MAGLANPSFHGFSEMLYEFTSAAANNGSGFEGLGDNSILEYCLWYSNASWKIPSDHRADCNCRFTWF